MTVKEVFELRKQGKIEEAYDAIRPMYAAHKGRYTTLCMFWTAADVFKLRLDQGRVEEATQILQALKRMLPRVDEVTKQLDRERSTSATQSNPAKSEVLLPWEREENKQSETQNKAAAFIASATRRLAKAQKTDKRSPVRATDHSRGCKPTDSKSSSNTEPHRGDTTPENPFHPDNPCPTETPPTNSQSSDSQLSTVNSQLSTVNSQLSTVNSQLSTVNSQLSTVNSQLSAVNSDDDLSGHLIVSLDDGIIRPTADLNPGQRVVLACITAHPGYNVPQISASTGIPAKSIERHVSALIDHNLIEHRGSKKTGGYYVK